MGADCSAWGALVLFRLWEKGKGLGAGYREARRLARSFEPLCRWAGRASFAKETLMDFLADTEVTLCYRLSVTKHGSLS